MKTKTHSIGDISAYVDSSTPTTEQDLQMQKKQKQKKLFRAFLLIIVAGQLVFLILLKFF
ncbi:hypothetical protein NEF87_000541 [Candidatus Lokiarchaeum ossiferum]|uniref:Uncharacterized protein n=1 Tax=Candidatus Lokiarchaeum ossiferum TaxID=2951803 RepID=A0ABY6HLH9_9ARCH|nr:hypothetical protein NEF87_000541 [Candidatus Lokiarchaeum sp. B-35]